MAELFEKCAHLLCDSPQKTNHSFQESGDGKRREVMIKFLHIYNMIYIYILYIWLHVYIYICNYKYTDLSMCTYHIIYIYICDCVYIYIYYCIYIYIYYYIYNYIYIVIGLHPSSFRLDAVNSTSSNYPCFFDWKTCMPGVFTVSARIVIC